MSKFDVRAKSKIARRTVDVIGTDFARACAEKKHRAQRSSQIQKRDGEIAILGEALSSRSPSLAQDLRRTRVGCTSGAPARTRTHMRARACTPSPPPHHPSLASRARQPQLSRGTRGSSFEHVRGARGSTHTDTHVACTNRRRRACSSGAVASKTLPPPPPPHSPHTLRCTHLATRIFFS